MCICVRTCVFLRERSLWLSTWPEYLRMFVSGHVYICVYLLICTYILYAQLHVCVCESTNVYVVKQRYRRTFIVLDNVFEYKRKHGTSVSSFSVSMCMFILRCLHAFVFCAFAFRDSLVGVPGAADAVSERRR